VVSRAKLSLPSAAVFLLGLFFGLEDGNYIFFRKATEI
jgi:hypothetical protein